MNRLTLNLERPLLVDYIRSISLPTVCGVLFIAIIAAGEVGSWIGRREARQRGSDKHSDTMATATLGLLALLIAFSYSMALTRYDLRRSVVLEEANAIGSTANFALMLPAEDQPPIMALLRDYTAVRIGLGVPYDPEKMRADVKRSTELQVRLWQKAVAITAVSPQSLPAYRFVASLNEMNNIGEKRLTALRVSVPPVVLLMLSGTALVALGFVGYSESVEAKNRRIPTIIMSLLLALLITLTLDLERPDRGSVEVSKQPLIDTINAIPPG